MAECRMCDLSITRKHVVFGEGNKTAEIMIVGETPSYYEDKYNKIFSSDSNKYLLGLLNANGIDNSNSYITNCVKCRTPKNRTPYDTELSTCIKFFLSKEIQVVDPVFIITIGKASSKLLTGKDLTMGKFNGFVFPVGKRWVLPLYHPNFILQNDNMKSEYENTIKSIKEKLSYIRSEYLLDIAVNFNKNITAPF